jgi:hypothetical protein
LVGYARVSIDEQGTDPQLDELRAAGLDHATFSVQNKRKYTMPVTRTSGQGRPKGALNKRTLDVIDKLAALHCDPIAGVALIAMNEKNPVELRARMYYATAHANSSDRP